MLCNDLKGWDEGDEGMEDRMRVAAWRQFQNGGDMYTFTADSHYYTTETSTTL